MYKRLVLSALLTTTFLISFSQESCLFKNPLCFYNTDILSYLQVLHKNQQYEKMTPFFYGPLLDSLGDQLFTKKLSDAEFGYTLKRVGVKEPTKNNWSLTYQRTILGTNENFKIDCAFVNNICKIYINVRRWDEIFRSKF
jgi:hypothetical protein